MKVLFHIGDSMTLQTKGDSGQLNITPDSISIRADASVEIKFASMQKVEWTTMPGGGHMVKIAYGHGTTMYLCATRINWGGMFVIVNYSTTRELYEYIANKISERTSWQHRPANIRRMVSRSVEDGDECGTSGPNKRFETDAQGDARGSSASR